MKAEYICFFSVLLFCAFFAGCHSDADRQPKKLEFDFQNPTNSQKDSLSLINHDLPVPFLIKGEIPKGGILAQVLAENNLNGNDVYATVNSLDSIFDLRRVQPGDKFEVMTDSTGYIYEMTFFRNPVKKYFVFRDSAGAMRAKIVEAELEKSVELIEGVLESSLYKTVLDAGEQPALAMLFTQIFQWDIDFFIDPRQGDKIRILFEKFSLEGNHIRYGNILAAAYESKTDQSIAYRYTDKKGSSKYYDEKGNCFQKAFLKSPLNYSRITSKFGVRTHPITKKRSMHNGVDYAAPYGTPVEAAADGVIEQANWNPGHTGNTVIIRHPNGYKTLYGHLSKFGKYKKGMKVKQHDVIGYVGSTGRSTGNHLHYTIYLHGNPVNPLNLKNVAGPPVPNSEMTIFNQRVNTLKSQLFADLETAKPALDSAFISTEDTEQLLDEEIYLPVDEADHKDYSVLLTIIIIAQFCLIVLLILLLIKKTSSKKWISE